MGHYWREIDPEGAAAHDEFIERLLALRARLSTVSLGDFTTVELGPLMRVMGYIRDEPRPDDLVVLEKKKGIKRARPKRKHKK